MNPYMYLLMNRGRSVIQMCSQMEDYIQMEKGMNRGMYTSDKSNWGTPQWIIDAVNKEFPLDLDVCADDQNHKADRYFTEYYSGLDQVWEGNCWMNPPYGRAIGKWCRKAQESSELAWHNQKQCTVIALLPARTDTKWWHDYVMNAAYIFFLEGRIIFEGAENPAPFPSALVIWDHENKRPVGPLVRSMKRATLSFSDTPFRDAMSGAYHEYL